MGNAHIPLRVVRILSTGLGNNRERSGMRKLIERKSVPHAFPASVPFFSSCSNAQEVITVAQRDEEAGTAFGQTHTGHCHLPDTADCFTDAQTQTTIDSIYA